MMKNYLWFFLVLLLIVTGLSFCTKEVPPSLETTKKNESSAKDSTDRPIEITNTVVTIETARDVIATFEIINNSGLQITSAGVCWSTSQNPTIDDCKDERKQALGNKNYWIELLEKSTTYHLRAFASILGVGTFYGSEVTFTTPATSPQIAFNPNLTYGSVSDVDGNTYRTIQIGAQTWMAENLKTTSYYDGSPITFYTCDPSLYPEDWFDYGDGNYRYNNGAYCWYYNDASTYRDIFGALYNWHAVNTGKLCPPGWHVPAYSEWTTLMGSLGCAVEAFNDTRQNASVDCNFIFESGFTPFIHGELEGWGFGRSI
jgi:uncharacterized protein (TIGR02145 family)